MAGAGVLQPGGQHAKGGADRLLKRYGGQLPADYAALRALPGIGDYLAGGYCLHCIWHQPGGGRQRAAGIARLDNSSADITKPAAKREFTARVLEEMPKERPGYL